MLTLVAHNRTMSRSSAQFGLVLSMLLTVMAVHAANGGDGKGTRTYRWIDDNGVVQYGDKIPPEYATRERAVLNSQGVVIQKLEAQKTPEQIAAEVEAARLRAEREQRDQFLLTTYTSVRDIEALRDERLVQLRGQVTAAQAYIATLDERLGALSVRAQGFRPYAADPRARPMPEGLVEDIVRTMNETRSQRKALDGKRAEETDLLARFDADIRRYRELKLAAAQRQ